VTKFCFTLSDCSILGIMNAIYMLRRHRNKVLGMCNNTTCFEEKYYFKYDVYLMFEISTPFYTKKQERLLSTT
jgi:hypothetical protein